MVSFTSNCILSRLTIDRQGSKRKQARKYYPSSVSRQNVWLLARGELQIGDLRNKLKKFKYLGIRIKVDGKW